MADLYSAMRKLWQACSKCNDRLFRRGCDFAGWAEAEDLGFTEQEGHKYQPSFGVLRHELRRYTIRRYDSILDIGCGKGRAMYDMHHFPFGRIEGYDISPDLVEIANCNFRKLGYDNCRAFCANAMEFDGYDDYNWFYCFNAVPEPVFQAVMEKIGESIRRNPRKCTFLYLHPVCHDYIIRHTDFVCTHTSRAPVSWMVVSHYENL